MMNNKHLERLIAMRDDNGLTWDLSGQDRAAFAWVVEQIERAEKDRKRTRKTLDVVIAALDHREPDLEDDPAEFVRGR